MRKDESYGSWNRVGIETYDQEELGTVQHLEADQARGSYHLGDQEVHNSWEGSSKYPTHMELNSRAWCHIQLLTLLFLYYCSLPFCKFPLTHVQNVSLCKNTEAEINNMDFH